MKRFSWLTYIASTVLFISLFLPPPYAAAQQQSWWSLVFPNEPVKKILIEGLAYEVVKQADIESYDTFHEKTDAVRQLVHSNSIHKIDQELYSYWHNIPILLDKIKTSIKDESSHKPHLECSSRSAVTYHLLKALNIRSRIIVVYPYENVSKNHVYLEVYNPETESWEIQDPDYNNYWAFKGSMRRASTEDMLRYPVEETFVPCRMPGDCGYEKIRVGKRKLDWYALASVIDIDENYHPLLVNPARFNPDHPFIKNEPNLPYCALFKGKCYQEIIKIENKTNN